MGRPQGSIVVRPLAIQPSDCTLIGGAGWGGVLHWWYSAGFHSFEACAWSDLILLRVAPSWPEGCRIETQPGYTYEGTRVVWDDLVTRWRYIRRQLVPDVSGFAGVRLRTLATALRPLRQRRAFGELMCELWEAPDGRRVYWSTRARELVDRMLGPGQWIATLDRPDGTPFGGLVCRPPGCERPYAFASIIPEGSCAT